MCRLMVLQAGTGYPSTHVLMFTSAKRGRYWPWIVVVLHMLGLSRYVQCIVLYDWIHKSLSGTNIQRDRKWSYCRKRKQFTGGQPDWSPPFITLLSSFNLSTASSASTPWRLTVSNSFWMSLSTEATLLELEDCVICGINTSTCCCCCCCCCGS